MLFIDSVLGRIWLVKPWLNLECQYKVGLFEKASWKQWNFFI